MSAHNVSETVNAGLCCGCGTCVAICPNSAIKLVKNQETYYPKVQHEKCNECSLCLYVCPGLSVDFEKLNLKIFGKKPHNPLAGNYIATYIGYSTNNNLRYNAASGGMVTQLLTFLLDQKFIDGAIVTKMKTDSPFQPQPFIARTKMEIVNACKSKYCPVPLNVILKEILKSKYGRFAVVGLPCHIEAIRKAESIYEALSKKIVIHLGLFCGYTPTFLATRFLLQKLNITESEVSRIDYRGEGWPGSLSVHLKTGTKVCVPFDSPYYWGCVFGSFFYTKRCSLCVDKLCELADISFGDAWLPVCTQDKLGTSIIIVRSKMGEKVLNDALAEKVIELKRISIDEVLQSQITYIKKRRANARLEILRFFGRKTPYFNCKLPAPKLSDYLRALFFYPLNYLSSKEYRYIDLYVKMRRLHPFSIV